MNAIEQRVQRRRAKTLKPKKCKVCRLEFQPFSSLSKTCTLECALKLVRLAQQHDLDRACRLERVRLKSRQKWLSEAQAVFNKFVRIRDEKLPCISCGRFHDGAYDAGHYRTSAAAPELRFNEDNCHKQCVPCNQHLSGDLVRYRIGLLQKIGPDRLARLEGFHEPRKYTIDELIAIKKEYQQKTKMLKAQRELI
jgi:hypothetical protein